MWKRALTTSRPRASRSARIASEVSNIPITFLAFDLLLTDTCHSHRYYQDNADVIAALDAELRQVVDYPAVSLDVATYNLDMNKWWIKSTGPNWRDTMSQMSSWKTSWNR